MPEHEFEIYLSVLSRLLKLTPEQTASIEDELRDHLEERFEELVRSGVERDEAIRQALDEFGDASGLAVDLTRVSQKPVRRWVIGSSIVTAAALLVGATVFLMSEPDTASLPGATTAVAQTQPETPQPIDLQSLLLDPQPDDVGLIQLSELSPINFVSDYPLQDAVNVLTERHHVPIVIDRQGLSDLGLATDEALNVPPLGMIEDGSVDREPSNWTHQPTLAQTLDVMLRDLELTWYVRDGIIVVTNRDVEAELRFARSYNVGPLLRSGIPTESLTELLKKHTHSNWEDVDGEGGRVAVVGNVLTVWQSYQAQREVRQLLLKLASPGELPWVDFAEERESFARFMQQPASANFVADCPLTDLVETFASQLGATIVIDSVAINEVGLMADQPLNVPVVASVPRSAIFRLALDEHYLTVILKHGVPTVTTIDVARDSSSLTTGIYRVADLLKPDREARALIDAIQSSAGGYWEEVDGVGGALTLTGNGMLVVSQSAERHRSIQRLLAIWGASPNTSKASVPVNTASVTKFYHMPIETAESLKTVLPEMVAPESWKTDDNSDGGTIQVIALAQKPVREAEPETQDADPVEKSEKKPDAAKKTAWNGAGGRFVFAQSGGGGLGGGQQSSGNGLLDFYSESTGVLIITQTPAVHREIDRFLASLRVSTRGRNEATEAEAAGGFGGGFGGGTGGGLF